MREQEGGEGRKKIRQINRRDKGIELMTLREMAQDRDEYVKWINGPTKYLKLDLMGEEDGEGRATN